MLLPAYCSITANSVNTIVSWGLRPDDVVPQYMPFFHTGGLNCLLRRSSHAAGDHPASMLGIAGSIQSVLFVDALPKTGANKVDKQRLIEQFGSSEQGR